MGRRGPPKKPTDLKILQGIPGGKHKLPKNEFRPPKIKKPKPAFKLDPVASRIFKRTSTLLSNLGLLTDVDVNALTRYADTFAKWLKAKEKIDKDGLTIEYTKEVENEETGEVTLAITHSQQRPEVAIYHNFSQQLTRLEAQFGMSPSARTGLTITTPKQESKDSVRSKLFG